ncbi:MAG: hypothetical protein M3279_07805 [Actinomycetota bacterium]|nr:hypothetical protein [Actinomycetota bacterium]
MRRWRTWRAVLVVAIVAELFVLLVIAIDAGKGDACERWQEHYEAMGRHGGDAAIRQPRSAGGSARAAPGGLPDPAVDRKTS